MTCQMCTEDREFVHWFGESQTENNQISIRIVDKIQ